MDGKESNGHRLGRPWLAAWQGSAVMARAAALATALLATTAAIPAGGAAAAALPHDARHATLASAQRPGQHAPAAAAPGAGPQWIRIAAGGNSTCGIREGNTLWCWGAGNFGALGDGHGADAFQPRQITRPANAGWASVTVGDDDGCATRSDGTLWCWGANYDGQLGTMTVNQNRPQQVTTPASTGWTTVTAGADHTCATRGDGTLWCWGASYSGQLGTGTTTSQDEPQQVTSPASTGWISVTAGGYHTCAIRGDGTLWCWGWNGLGQLGTATTTNQDRPRQVTTPASAGWSSVTAGLDHTCATRIHGLWCWGNNSDGELGLGNTTIRDQPRRVFLPTRTGWSLMALGDSHTCATHTGHTLWCWGANHQGQLGIGSSTDQNLPKQVTS